MKSSVVIFCAWQKSSILHNSQCICNVWFKEDYLLLNQFVVENLDFIMSRSRKFDHSAIIVEHTEENKVQFDRVKIISCGIDMMYHLRKYHKFLEIFKPANGFLVCITQDCVWSFSVENILSNGLKTVIWQRVVDSSISQPDPLPNVAAGIFRMRLYWVVESFSLHVFSSRCAKIFATHKPATTLPENLSIPFCSWEFEVWVKLCQDFASRNFIVEFPSIRWRDNQSPP